jgi:hypothetical protein
MLSREGTCFDVVTGRFRMAELLLWGTRRAWENSITTTDTKGHRSYER